MLSVHTELVKQTTSAHSNGGGCRVPSEDRLIAFNQPNIRRPPETVWLVPWIRFYNETCRGIATQSISISECYVSGCRVFLKFEFNWMCGSTWQLSTAPWVGGFFHSYRSGVRRGRFSPVGRLKEFLLWHIAVLQDFVCECTFWSFIWCAIKPLRYHTICTSLSLPDIYVELYGGHIVITSSLTGTSISDKVVVPKHESVRHTCLVSVHFDGEGVTISLSGVVKVLETIEDRRILTHELLLLTFWIIFRDFLLHASAPYSRFFSYHGCFFITITVQCLFSLFMYGLIPLYMGCNFALFSQICTYIC